MRIIEAPSRGFTQRPNGDWGKIVSRKVGDKTIKVFQKYHIKRCKRCGDEFLTVNNGIYCGQRCMAYASGLNKSTKGRTFKGSRGTIGKKKITHNGYVEIYDPFHPLADKHGRVAEHRLVIYNTGHRFKPSEDVHHINGIKTDNRRKNLIVLTRSDHNIVEKKRQVRLRKRNGHGQFT